MAKKILAFLVAAICTYVIAVIFVGQFNIAYIVELGYPASLGDRLGVMLDDLIGMLGTYLPLIMLGLLIALLFTGLVLTRFLNTSLVLYALAGFFAVIAIHLIMLQVFGMHPVAPTRTLPGLLSQGLAGLLGGAVYYRMALAQQPPA